MSLDFHLPKESSAMTGPLDVPSPPPASADHPPAPEPAAHGPLALETVIDSVTRRYPPYLSTLLEKDLASGRLTQAMGAFDTTLGAKVGGQVLPPKEILESVWGPGYDEQERLVWQLIHRLRQKIEPDPHNPRYILIKPGIGYYLDVKPSHWPHPDAGAAADHPPTPNQSQHPKE